MITATQQSMHNLIVEAASDLIYFVVQSIVDAPPDAPRPYLFRPDWLSRYGAIKDLNVITAKSNAYYLHDSPDYVDRFPYAGFFFNGARLSPLEQQDGALIGSLGCMVGVQGETFSLGQVELFEIHDCIRSILYLDKSLGEIRGRGAVIDAIRWAAIGPPAFDEVTMRDPFLSVLAYYDIAFREEIYR